MMKKRKWMNLGRLACALLLVASLAGCGAPLLPAQAEAAAIGSPQTADALNARKEAEAKALAAYAPYGMTYDKATRQLTYEGKRVRYFEDLYALNGTATGDEMAGMTFFDEEGTVDIRATRDLTEKKRNPDGSYDPSGVLTGVVPYSQAEFDARDLEPLRNPTTNAASAGEPLSAAERERQYAPYADYGLTYDAQTDKLFYEGKQVRRFTDILSTNGEAPESGKFQGTMHNRWDEGGTVDVQAVRDYARGKDGNGLLTGIKTATQAEFDAATAQNKKGPLLCVYDIATVNTVETATNIVTNAQACAQEE